MVRRRYLVLFLAAALLLNGLTLIPGLVAYDRLRNDPYWSTFWSGLSYGAIVATVFGVFAGLFAWWIQQQIEQRLLHIERTQQYSREISAFKRKLSEELDVGKREPLNNLTLQGAIPPAAVRAHHLAEQYPVDEWLRYLPEQAPLLDNVLGISKTIDNLGFINRSIDGELILRIAPIIEDKRRSSKGGWGIRQPNDLILSDGSIMSMEDSRLIEYIKERYTGHLIGMNSETITEIMPGFTHTFEELLDEMCQALLKDSKLNKDTKPFRVAIDNLHKSIDAVWLELNR